MISRRNMTALCGRSFSLRLEKKGVQSAPVLHSTKRGGGYLEPDLAVEGFAQQ